MTAPILTPRVLPEACAFTLHRCPDGTYETPDGVWVVLQHRSRWRVLRRTAGPVVPGHDKFRTLRDASHMLRRHLTRYTYRVSPGEQCAVCGAPRPALHGLLAAEGYEWWWHTSCRALTDPEGAARYTSLPGDESGSRSRHPSRKDPA